VSDAHDHSARIDAWMRQAGGDVSPKQLLQLFEQAMGALWNRAGLTLGDVTLAAIVDRVLHTAAEQFPPFASLKVERAGIDFREFRAQTTEFSQSELLDGVRFVVTEFIVVIGNLTAEILTPALHAELSKVTLKDHAPGGEPGKENS
jgi:hypothetical protein